MVPTWRPKRYTNAPKWQCNVSTVEQPYTDLSFPLFVTPLQNAPGGAKCAHGTQCKSSPTGVQKPLRVGHGSRRAAPRLRHGGRLLQLRVITVTRRPAERERRAASVDLRDPRAR